MESSQQVDHGERGADAAVADHGDGHGHGHPRYMLVWFWLAILTAAEVGVVFLEFLPKSWIIMMLLAMAVWKAALVGLYFMHLRFEPKRVAMVAIAPLPLAVILILAVLMEYR